MTATVDEVETLRALDAALDDSARIEAHQLVSRPVESAGFSVNLDEFAGPFDLLLSLIAKHKLEVAELALHQVTDDFCAYIRNQGSEWDLAEATSFLVVAATLLDLKAARLLPSGEVEDEADLALLESRDLLFARLLQYRAFKEVAALFDECLSAQARRVPRVAGMDPEFASLLPEVVLSIGLERFGAIAAEALAPRVIPTVGLDHIHAPRASVSDQAMIMAKKLAQIGQATFRELAADAGETAVVVARFLSLLELFRQGRVSFEQPTPRSELVVSWIELDQPVSAISVSSEFDEIASNVQVTQTVPSDRDEVQT